MRSAQSLWGPRSKLTSPSGARTSPSVYELVFEHELKQKGLPAKRQVPISIVYKGIVFAEAFRADLLVADKVIVELKSVEQINKAHRKQLQTYLRLTHLKLGYIFNFAAPLMKERLSSGPSMASRRKEALSRKNYSAQ